jgi:hypothetical protein
VQVDALSPNGEWEFANGKSVISTSKFLKKMPHQLPPHLSV